MNTILLAILPGDWISDDYDITYDDTKHSNMSKEEDRIAAMEKEAAADEMGINSNYAKDYVVAKNIQLAGAIERLGIDLLGFEEQTGVEIEIEPVYDKELDITNVMGNYLHASDAAVVRLSLGKIHPSRQINLMSDAKYSFIWPSTDV